MRPPLQTSSAAHAGRSAPAFGRACLRAVRFSRHQFRRYRRSLTLNFHPWTWLRDPWPSDERRADVKAGCNVGLLGFPQGIAYALIAGVPAQFGLISSSLGAAVGACFSGSRFVVLGPTNATAVLLFSGLAATGLGEADRLAALPLFVLMVGAFQILGAFLRIEHLLAFISRAVVTGYITAAAALIIVHQLPHVLGYSVGGATTFFSTLGATVRLLGESRGPEALMSVSTLTFYIALRRFWPQAPNVALSLLFAGAVGAVFRWLGWELTWLQGCSLEHLNPLRASFNFELVGQLAPAALAVAFVSILEGTSVGQALAARSGTRLNTGQEVYAMGVANVANAFCGGMNASGSLTRSALNWNSGARTARSIIVSGCTVFLLLVSLGWLIGFLPRAALAVLVIVIALSLFHRRHLHMALKTTRSDAIVLLTTTGSALLFRLDTAIYLGVVTSLVLFLKKAGRTELVEYHFTNTGQLAELPEAQRRPTAAISILHVEGDLFFGSTDLFMTQIRSVIADPRLRIVVLRVKNARNLDFTCMTAIEELVRFLRSGGRHLLVSGADAEVQRVFRNSRLLDDIGRENFFPEVPGNPTLATRHALQRARQLLGNDDVDVHVFVDPAVG